MKWHLLPVIALCAGSADPLSAAPPMPAAPDQEPASGFDIGASYVSDTLAVAHGGVRRGAELLGKADLTAQYAGTLFGVEGATAWLDLQYVHGRSFSDRRAGDAQTASNIDAVSAVRPFEAWLRVPVRFGTAEVTVTAGLVDLNGIFDVQEVGRIFLNSSHGIGPDFSQSGRNGPSIFPTTAPAITFSTIRGPWSARFGLFEAIAGDPEHLRRTVLRVPGTGGVLVVGEVDRTLGPATVQLGGWAYSARFDALAGTAPDGDTRRSRGNRGIYGLVEGRLYGRPAGRRLDCWLRVGLAQPRINPIAAYVGGGVTYGDDVGRAGIALAHARLGQPGMRALAERDDRPARAETSIEFTYSHRFSPWLRVQPDLQYIIDPSWRRDIGNALALGLRLVFEPF